MEIKENVAYWCKTETLAKEFLQECLKQNIRWNSGDDVSKTNWENYKEKTCYTYRYKWHDRIYEGLLSSNYDSELFDNAVIIEYKGPEIDKLQQKIYNMSNSHLPLDMFYNDIRVNTAPNYNKDVALRNLEIIADFIIDLQQKNEQIMKMLDDLIKNIKAL